MGSFASASNRMARARGAHSSSPRSPIRSSRRCSASAATHVFPASNPSAAERLSLVAVGGYGRGTLAPHSDIDLLFLFPWKQTAWSESVTEYILYLLWDLRLKVGHATRTVNEALKAARGYDRPHRAARGASDRRDEPLFRELKTRFQNEVVAGTAREFIAAIAGRARCAARPRRPVALPRRAERQGRKRRAARPADALLDCQCYYRVDANRRSSMPDSCRVRNTRSSFAARTSCGRSAVICALTGRGEERLSVTCSRARHRLGYQIAPRPAGGRAVHEALLPDRQGRGRSDAHRMRGARRARGEERPAAQSFHPQHPLAAPRAEGLDGFRGRARAHQHRRRERLRARPGEPRPHLPRGGQARHPVPSRRAPPHHQVTETHRPRSAGRSGGPNRLFLDSPATRRTPRPCSAP